MPENTSLPHAPKRRIPSRMLAIAVVVAVLLGGSVWLLTAQASRPANVAGPAAPTAPSATPEPSSAAEPGSTAAPAPEATDEHLTENTADVVLADYFEAMDALKPDTDLDGIAAVVTGDALAEVEAQQLEFESRGWSLTGSTRFEDVSVVEADLESDRPTATVSVCVDSSDVQLMDEDNSPVSTATDESRRAINLYSLAYTDGAWRVTSHTFPDDPQC
jgi:cytoskeletal protein RodZ